MKRRTKLVTLSCLGIFKEEIDKSIARKVREINLKSANKISKPKTITDDENIVLSESAIDELLSLLKSLGCNTELLTARLYGNPNVKLLETTLTLSPGMSQELKAEVEPNWAKINWSTEDDKVAKVKDGIVSAIEPGETNIIAEIGGFKASCKIIVKI